MPLLVLLGLGQIISWGTLYYGLAILAQPILRETQWPEWVVYGAFSLGLMLWGLGAPTVGSWIDAGGGRYAMSIGSLLAALAFLTLAMADTPLIYTFGWLLAGSSMALTLYDAAFAVIHQINPRHYRRHISLLTFMGGFASTVFWPLGFYLQQTLGWRETLWFFALLHLGMVLLHWLFIPASSTILQNMNRAVESRAIVSDQNRIRVLPGQVWFMWAFSLATMVFSTVSVFIVDALSLQGFSTEQAVWLAALIGPMQVAGRLLEWLFGYYFTAYRVGLVCMLALVVSMLVLNIAAQHFWLGLTFVLLYGVANGIMTLVRGALPLELYGPVQVGGLLGRLAKPVLLTKALTPGLLSIGLSNGVSLKLVLWLLLMVTLLALVSYWQLNRSVN